MSAILAVDGIDATGKSAVIREVVARNPELLSVDEFSNTELGDLIRRIISRERFFSLAGKDGQRVEAAESYLLFADTVAKIERIASSTQQCSAAMERGFLSLFGYQLARMHRRDMLNLADSFKSSIASSIGALNQLHSIKYSEVLLVISQETLVRRIALRGECELTPRQSSFLLDAQEAMKEMAHSFAWLVVENDSEESINTVAVMIAEQLVTMRLKINTKNV